MHDSNLFLTLTYNDEHLPDDKSIHKSAIQLFLKRLRKAISPTKIRFFAVGEYGEKFGRPHYHLIIFGLKWCPDNMAIIRNCWSFGFCYFGSVTLDSARYVACYVQKKLTGKASAIYKQKGLQPEFALMSRRPGLGASFADKYRDMLFRNRFWTEQGKKLPIPRYMRARICRDEHEEGLYADAVKNYFDDSYIKFCTENHIDLSQPVSAIDRQVWLAKGYETERRLSRMADKKRFTVRKNEV